MPNATPTAPAPRFLRGRSWSFTVLGVVAALAGLLSLAFAPSERTVALDVVDGDDPPSGSGSSVAVGSDELPGDPDLEARIADDVVAYVNSERRARSMTLLGILDDTHATAANEARLRDQEPDRDLLEAYGEEAVVARELHVRLGTGTRSGEAVAGWVANDQADTLLDRSATGIAVAAACQPGERGGDLVITVHVVQSASGPTAPGPIADDRPGAGRGEACQFADLATGPTAQDGTLAPAAVTLAATVALALALLEWQRRRHRAGLLASPQRVAPPDGPDEERSV
ncbi:hypothetical protein [Egicoccus halophilus]|uniref:hypothetical protein n=1 Tax=Egicoccus halophilus TaxID=1670830 RepID=UPI00103179FD|nr:hypothetical protein [Egicoccus halophilus]